MKSRNLSAEATKKKEKKMKRLKNESPLFDRLDLLNRLDNDEELLKEIIVLFIDNCGAQMSQLAQALSINDFKQISEIAHSLKGASASISSPLMKEVAEKIEKSALAKDLSEINSLLTNFKVKFENFKQIDHLSY
jgi:HPt (histidine-containing phosphotransfer) domain-containing protein